MFKTEGTIIRLYARGDKTIGNEGGGCDDTYDGKKRKK